MSYNNYLDVDSAWNCVSDSENPRCAVMKHTNPGEVYWLAVIADPGSTFGSIEAANVKADKGFFATKRKDIYCVADHKLTICFTHNIVLSEIQYNPVVIERDMFRFLSFQDFERGPLINVYLWDQATDEFYNKFNNPLATPTPAVVLVTSVNTKLIGACCSRVLYLCNSYHAEISVYDNGENATFVHLGDTGTELTRRHASELIDNYFEMEPAAQGLQLCQVNLSRRVTCMRKLSAQDVTEPATIQQSNPCCLIAP
ncbi:hypothetical protein Bca52824_057149 [Brassica carinata]|uniref:Uncharacterized protein n=1 Tax=Brassica carinata TaxID=52824 RepID=A0A8X7QPZ2_BRACI|nr:hypothetical protein Bca52824_057149 [Brassica carinata]